MSNPTQPVWPPIIVAKKSFWITTRDFILTVIMWLIFFVMLGGESNLLFGALTDRLGLRDDLEWLGFGDVSIHRDGPIFLRALVPYLGIAFILVISLLSFTFDTLQRRRRALRGPPAPPLPAAIEALHAELSTMAGHEGSQLQARRAEFEHLVTIDTRSLLIAMNQLDVAALEDARSERVVSVHLTEDGHYRIQAAG